MFIGGVMSSLTNGPIMAIFQATVDPVMQGRVFTLIGSSATAMMPLGLALSGPMADIIGVRAWFVIGGTITILAGIGTYFIPALMNIEQERGNHEPAGELAQGAMPTPVNRAALAQEGEPV
jgi:DHA3 family macrolide efflux protein-like MFS transporter